MDGLSTWAWPTYLDAYPPNHQLHELGNPSYPTLHPLRNHVPYPYLIRPLRCLYLDLCCSPSLVCLFTRYWLCIDRTILTCLSCPGDQHVVGWRLLGRKGREGGKQPRKGDGCLEDGCMSTPPSTSPKVCMTTMSMSMSSHAML